MHILRTVAALGVLIPGLLAQGDTFYVDDDAPAGGNGQSWSQAFRFLQDALVAAENEGGSNTVRVAQGTYLPDRSNANPIGTGNRAATFDVPGATTIRGGYAGVGASNPNERNIDKYQTILTGDLAGDGTGIFDTAAENSRHVMKIINRAGVVQISGLTITGGFANADADQRGAGLLIEDSDAELDFVRFVENAARHTERPRGAGLFAVRSQLTLTDCTFLNNQINGAGGFSAYPHAGGAGMGVQVTTAILERCDFENNYISSGSGENSGGGIWAASQSSITARHCRFIDNDCYTDISYAAGGAVYLTSSAAAFESCTFNLNTAHGTFADINGDGDGGAIYATGSDLSVLHCSFVANNAYGDQGGFGGAIWMLGGEFRAINCEFLKNSASADTGEDSIGGGAIFGGGDSGQIINCTFARNRPQAIVRQTAEPIVIRNSIFWENGIEDPLWNQYEEPGGTSHFDVAWSCAQHEGDVFPGLGNIAENPQLLDLEANNARLTADSPCIDAASNSALDSAVTLDLRGAVRQYNDPTVPDTGQGSSPIVDMGAFEYFADCNNNLQPDDADLALFSVEFASGNLSPFGFDRPREVSFNAPFARTEVRIQIEAAGDLNGAGEFISVELNGESLGSAFAIGASDCANPPNKHTILLTADEFNAIVHDAAVLRLTPSASVSSGACNDANFIRVNVTFSSSIAVDKNGDGVPDSCGLMGDLNHDSVVNVFDLFALLEAWGPCASACPPACLGDISGPGGAADCTIDVFDLFALLANWTG